MGSLRVSSHHQEKERSILLITDQEVTVEDTTRRVRDLIMVKVEDTMKRVRDHIMEKAEDTTKRVRDHTTEKAEDIMKKVKDHITVTEVSTEPLKRMIQLKIFFSFEINQI